MLNLLAFPRVVGDFNVSKTEPIAEKSEGHLLHRVYPFRLCVNMSDRQYMYFSITLCKYVSKLNTFDSNYQAITKTIPNDSAAKRFS